MAKILGLDHGERRVGVAVSDPSGVIAMPLRVIDVTEGEKVLLAEINGICRDKEVVKIVIGLPMNMNGTKGPMAEKIETFAVKLMETTRLPVVYWDERLSTRMAERTLIEADMSRAKRKQVRDKISAQIILQGYLDMMNMLRQNVDQVDEKQ